MRQAPLTDSKLLAAAGGQLWVGFCGACLFGFFHQRLVKEQPLIFLSVMLYFSAGYLFSKLGLRQKVLAIAAAQWLAAGWLVTFCRLQVDFAQLLVSMGLTVLYQGYFGLKPLRQQPWLKNLVIGASWAAVFFAVPGPAMGPSVFFSIVLFIFGLMMGFDIRDVQSDRFATLPRKFGVSAAKKIGIVAFGCSLVFFSIEQNSLLLPWIFTLIFSILFLFGAHPHRSRYYFSIIGEMMCCLPLIFSLAMPKFTLCY